MTGQGRGPRIVPVVVIVPPRVLMLDVAGPVEVLRKANLLQDGLRFDVTYAGPRPTVRSSIGLEVSGIAPLPDTLPAGAMVLVSGAADVPLATASGPSSGSTDPGGKAQEGHQETEIVRWLKRMIRPGIRLATICSGAMLAGRAGLLDGHDCTTHYETVSQLRACAPLARVQDNRLFVEDGERLTSAGITAGIDMMLALVAREAGHGIATAVARYMVVYMRRGGADPQLSPWLQGRNHMHPAIHKVQDAVSGNPARDWPVGALADLAATSPRTLSRLFNQHTGLSVTDYVNRMRIALAHELVAGTRLDMESVAEKAGFSSPRQFRRAWNRFYDQPPSHFRA